MLARLPDPASRVAAFCLAVLLALAALFAAAELPGAAGAETGTDDRSRLGMPRMRPSAETRSIPVQDWQWPVAAPPRVVRPFIAPATPYTAGHRGIDLAAAPGTAVLAPADGVIHFAGMVAGRPVLSIQHPGEVLTSLEPVQSSVAVGRSVRRGEVIGEVVLSLSSHCQVSCLHFGVRLRGGYLSPLNYLGGILRPVLLPTRTLG